MASLPLTVGKTFQLDYEAVLGGLIDINGVTFTPPGLNSTYQITVVASFTEVVTSTTGASASFSLAPVQSPNSYFEVYYNPALTANNLAGTGFNDGTRILTGSPSSDQSSSGNFNLALDSTNQPIIQAFDQFDPTSYPGQLSVTGVGSSLINVNVASFDPTFFVSPVVSLGFNTSTATPFNTTEPAKLFAGLPNGAAPNIVANPGAINGVSGPDFQFQADANNSFNVAAPAIAIAKQTNGVTALTAPGPIVAVGSPVTWTYAITDPGNEPLKTITVVDDAGTAGVTTDDFSPTPILTSAGLNVGDTNDNGLLDPGESWSYTATGTAKAGQYENTVVTTGVGTLSGTSVTSSSISHYFAAAPAIAIAKQTNGVTALTAPGPIVAVGSPVTWTYAITDPGNEPLKTITVVDDAGTAGVATDDFSPTPILTSAGLNVGDTNDNGLLDPGESWSYTATGTAKAGQYENTVVTTGVGTLSGTSVTSSSISHYFAAAPAIAIAKQTNGVTALTAPGPIVAVGSPVTWTYAITDPGNEPLKTITIVDDAGTAGVATDDFSPTPILTSAGLNVGDSNDNGLLDPGESWSYTATGTAKAGQYENTVVTTGVGTLSGTSVTSSSISHYFAAAPAIAIAKQTNGVTALTAPGPIVAVGSPVTWTYAITDPGNEPLKTITVVDDAGTAGVTTDDFSPTPILTSAGLNVGDSNDNGLLDPGESWSYTATGTAKAGQYENTVVTTGVGTLSGTSVTSSSISHYFAAAPATPEINIVKATNGVVATSPTGPVVTVGSTVVWTYDVTNPGTVALHNIAVADDNGTPGNLADDFQPNPVLTSAGFNVGDTNDDGLLEPGEDWKYTANGLAISGQYTNNAIVAGLSPAAVPVSAAAPSNYFGVCPTVISVQRFGVHYFATQIVVGFNGPLDPAQAQNIANYKIYSIGQDGRFDVPDPVSSAVYNATTNSVTLTLSHRLNVHHLSDLQVTNPCPGGPSFEGILNRKYSLGEQTIIGRRGHHFVFPATDIPTVLSPSILPARLLPTYRPEVNRLSLLPSSSAFASTSTITSKKVISNAAHPKVKISSSVPKTQHKILIKA